MSEPAANTNTTASPVPWYIGLRKVFFASLVLICLTATAFDKIIDGTQFVGAVGVLVAAFFTVNQMAKSKDKTQEKANG